MVMCGCYSRFQVPFYYAKRSRSLRVSESCWPSSLSISPLRSELLLTPSSLISVGSSSFLFGGPLAAPEPIATPLSSRSGGRSSRRGRRREPPAPVPTRDLDRFSYNQRASGATLRSKRNAAELPDCKGKN